MHKKIKKIKKEEEKQIKIHHPVDCLLYGRLIKYCYKS